MGDLDDRPDQCPLKPEQVRLAVMAILGEERRFDVLYTHSPYGEYSRHRRHEEAGRAICDLWRSGELDLKELRLFAYHDGGRSHYPAAVENAHAIRVLPPAIFTEKLRIITEIYGFPPDGWEARTCPRIEAFWCFKKQVQLRWWLKQEGQQS
jgi:hypothetical protein